MAKPIGESASRHLEKCDGDVAGRQNSRNRRRGNVLVLYPPKQVQRVGDPLDRDDAIEGIEREVPANPGSIRRHADGILTASTRYHCLPLTSAQPVLTCSVVIPHSRSTRVEASDMACTARLKITWPSKSQSVSPKVTSRPA